MKKVLIAFMILAVGVMMCVNFTYAASGDSFNVEASASKTEIKAGETVEVTFKLKDVKATGDTGFLALTGQLKYDANVFEQLTSNDIKGLNGWSPMINSANNNIALQGKELKADTEVLVVTLKAKTTLTAGTTNITLANIEGETDTTVTTNDVSTPNITVVVPSTPDKPTDPDQPTNPDKPTNPDQPTTPDKPTNPDKPTTPDGNNNNNNNNGGITINGGNNNQGTAGTTNNTNKTNNTSNTNKATGSLPKAGAETIIIPAIIVIAVIGGIAYNRYSKMKF